MPRLSDLSIGGETLQLVRLMGTLPCALLSVWVRPPGLPALFSLLTPALSSAGLSHAPALAFPSSILVLFDERALDQKAAETDCVENLRLSLTSPGTQYHPMENGGAVCDAQMKYKLREHFGNHQVLWEWQEVCVGVCGTLNSVAGFPGAPGPPVVTTVVSYGDRRSHVH